MVKEKSEIEIHREHFMQHLEVKLKRSQKTLENYDRYIKLFLEYSQVHTAKEIDSETVKNYKKWLKTKPVEHKETEQENETISEKTINYYLTALRMFLKYLRDSNVTSLEPKEVQLMKQTSSEPIVIRDEEILRIREVLEGKGIKNLRDRAIFLLLLSTGIRVSELCALDKDVDLRKENIHIIGKGGKKRLLPLTPETREAIHTYIHARKDDESALFVNNGKRTSDLGDMRLTPRTVQRVISQSAIRAGVIKKVTPHVLRHTFAQKQIGQGKDSNDIKEMLGYKSILSTQMYT